jgi:hypothetical protein
MSAKAARIRAQGPLPDLDRFLAFSTGNTPVLVVARRYEISGALEMSRLITSSKEPTECLRI